ncbi:NAD(P)-dependent oxidoreductase [Pseudalkalibacillus decolorationis]|uniref:NAD(P)-dependent oxidoreductase n=1 Tax=Pseudalkalibacillus decolorationis TaxID=163879 RepID=UPI0021477DED|nr:NAD(P)-dependent oxidoreductase [Pseudalkalibacillus decolorationis]
MKLGLIGLGNMGGRIAKRLLERGNQLHVYDVNADVLNDFEMMGAKTADSIKEVSFENEYVITVLPNADIVKKVVLGEEGLIFGLKPNSVLIDMTSSTPEVTKEISTVLEKHGIKMLDAPISGGVKRAEEGDLAVMVGGEESVLSEVLPFLEDIGSKITHVGESGAGHAIKALNNLISATTLSITLEALAVGIKYGLDPYKMLNVINNSTGKNNSSENKVAQQILSGKYEVGFSLDLMYKDLTTAIELSKRVQVPASVSSSVFQLWKYASLQGNGEIIDHTAIAKVIEQISDVKFGTSL